MNEAGALTLFHALIFKFDFTSLRASSQLPKCRTMSMMISGQERSGFSQLVI